MEISFLEPQKVKKQQTVKDKKGIETLQEVEVIENLPTPFEVHPNEMLRSVARRYANAKKRTPDIAQKKGQEPIPVLREAVTGNRVPDQTAMQFVKDRDVAVELIWVWA